MLCARVRRRSGDHIACNNRSVSRFGGVAESQQRAQNRGVRVWKRGATVSGDVDLENGTPGLLVPLGNGGERPPWAQGPGGLSLKCLTLGDSSTNQEEPNLLVRLSDIIKGTTDLGKTRECGARQHTMQTGSEL